MRILDLFCGAGGAAMGLHQAGFEVVGVDIKAQPHYPFEFHLADALTYPLEGFDAYWASPPCQAFCKYRNVHKDLNERYPDVIAPVRECLIAARKPYVIENVPRAPLGGNVSQLCGSSFGLPIRRHRLFETSWALFGVPCNHGWQKPQYPSSSDRVPMSRCTIEVGSWDIPLKTQREGMGIQWMTVEELSEAIPPAYSRFIGEQLMKALAESKQGGD
jgi:DNA (cytosine-5)-methyltransferase 1